MSNGIAPAGCVQLSYAALTSSRASPVWTRRVFGSPMARSVPGQERAPRLSRPGFPWPSDKPIFCASIPRRIRVTSDGRAIPHPDARLRDGTRWNLWRDRPGITQDGVFLARLGAAEHASDRAIEER